MILSSGETSLLYFLQHPDLVSLVIWWQAPSPLEPIFFISAVSTSRNKRNTLLSLLLDLLLNSRRRI